MPSAGTSEGVDRLTMTICCLDGCQLVAGFVADKFMVLIWKKPVNKGFLLSIYVSGNESNEILQENLKSKKRWPDDRLQVFRSPLPDFVADALCLAFLIYGGSLWGMKRQ